MLIYFDETYDSNHTYLVLGALFNPHSKFLHRRLTAIKKSHNFFTADRKFEEIKYNSCYSEDRFKVCKEAVDAFLESTSWYRAIVIKDLDLNYFGKPHELENIKKARAYKKYAEMLISSNTKHIVNGVLLTDELTRCNGDEFIEKMKETFCIPGSEFSWGKKDPTLKDVMDVRSDKDEYQVMQVCDLLSGCIINEQFPTKNPWKNEIRKYLLKNLGLPTLKETYWSQFKRWESEDNHPKFNVWYWKPKEGK